MDYGVIGLTAATITESTSTITKAFQRRNNITGVQYHRDIPVKLMLLGNQGVGKTSYSKRYISGEFCTNYQWTVGVDFALKVVKWSDTLSLKLQLWDIAGQERFTSMTRVYYKDAHACIIMFDLSQRSTFQSVTRWKKDLDSKCSLPDGSPVPCVLLANKCDLDYREVQQEEIEELCKDEGFLGWTEISVKEGLMVDEAMKFLLKEVTKKHEEIEASGHFTDETDSGNSSSKIRLGSIRTDRTGKCC